MTLTGSLNVTVRLAPTGKSVAPFTGKVPATTGGASSVGVSSLTIVPWPCPSRTEAPVTFVTLAKKRLVRFVRSYRR